MNSKIREELTGLLAEHLRITLGAPVYPWEQVAESAMDFIYGEPDGDVQEPECQEIQASHGFAWFGPEGGSCGDPCDCAEPGCSWPGDVDRLEGGPVGPDVVYGVVTPSEVLRGSFVYLGPLSRTEGYVPVPRSDSEPKAQ